MPRTLVMINRAVEDASEAEPLIVDTDDPKVIVLELDDGDRLEVDPTELRAALRGL
jgi:hypothetical protein